LFWSLLAAASALACAIFVNWIAFSSVIAMSVLLFACMRYGMERVQPKTAGIAGIVALLVLAGANAAAFYRQGAGKASLVLLASYLTGVVGYVLSPARKRKRRKKAPAGGSTKQP
jgi:hypothetical protein